MSRTSKWCSLYLVGVLVDRKDFKEGGERCRQGRPRGQERHGSLVPSPPAPTNFDELSGKSVAGNTESSPNNDTLINQSTNHVCMLYRNAALGVLIIASPIST